MRARVRRGQQVSFNQRTVQLQLFSNVTQNIACWISLQNIDDYGLKVIYVGHLLDNSVNAPCTEINIHYLVASVGYAIILISF